MGTGAVTLALFLVPVGLIAFGLGFSDWLKEKAFFKKAIETTGTIIGTVGAQYKLNVDVGGGTATTTAIQMATGSSSSKEASMSAGAFLRVEYETEDHIYNTRSVQNFDEIPAGGTVVVHYNPKNPKDAAIERYYLGKSMYYQIFGGLFLVTIPFIYQLFLS